MSRWGVLTTGRLSQKTAGAVFFKLFRETAAPLTIRGRSSVRGSGPANDMQQPCCISRG